MDSYTYRTENCDVVYLGCAKTSNISDAIEWIHLTLKLWKSSGSVKFVPKVVKKSDIYKNFNVRNSIYLQITGGNPFLKRRKKSRSTKEGR